MKRWAMKCLVGLAVVVAVAVVAYGLAAWVSGLTHGHGQGHQGPGTAPGLTSITGHKKGSK